MKDSPALPSVQSSLNLEHLQTELLRIDVLIHREIRRWRLAGQDPTDAFRGQYVTDDQADALLKRPFGASWGHTVSEPEKETQAYSKTLARINDQLQVIVEKARQQKRRLRLRNLAGAFGLDQFEIQTLLICLAPTLDLSYEALYGYLQDDVTRKRPSVNLVLNMLCKPGPERLLMISRFADDAPLINYKLLARVIEPGPNNQPLLSQTLAIDETIVSWLLGRYQPHSKLGPHTVLVPPRHNNPDSAAIEMQAGVRQLLNKLPVVVLYGLDQVKQQETAKLLAAQAGRSLLLVDLAAAIEPDTSPLYILKLALRDARLTGAIPCLLGWDHCLIEGNVPTNLLNELCAHPDTVMIIGKAKWQPQGIEHRCHFYWLEFPIPSYAERKALWTYLLEEVATHERLNVEDVAGQFALTTGQIRDVVATAQDMASQRNDYIRNEDIFVAARAHSSSRLAKLARKVEPRYTWDDIVLPDDQLAILQEVVATVRGRPKVLGEWNVGQKLVSSAGITLLFSGPPGTGKTMAAEVIAGELGLDLYKIDLSTVISKYIGETEKNLEKIFEEAESSNAILFFDEADAIFGKRSEVKDAHDRYANVEISYLLQRMEAYDGVTMLATNLRANLDEAFTRRLQFAIDFPFPEKVDRLRIWQTLFPPDVPRAPDLNFELLAQRFKLAGGNIRNIIVSAAYLAADDGGQVTMQHLLHGTYRELEKMGRLVGEEDLKLD